MKNTVIKFDKEELSLEWHQTTKVQATLAYISKKGLTDVKIGDTVNEYNDDDKIIEVSDYFSKDFANRLVFAKLLPYLKKYKVFQNDKLERISFELYQTPDYWDILLMINGFDPLFDMYYDLDYIDNLTTQVIEEYVGNKISPNGELISESRLSELYDDVHKDKNTRNESFKYIYVVEETSMTDVLSILKAEGYA